jgi:hypothetical protein
MFKTVFYTLMGIPSGYFITSIMTNNISTVSKCSIITTITFIAFLKGYTGNDLITNICQTSVFERRALFQFF